MSSIRSSDGRRTPDPGLSRDWDDEASGHADTDTPEAPDAARVGADDDRIRALRSDVASIGQELGSHQTELAKLEVALRNLESTGTFLKRGDPSRLTGGESLPTEIQMRIVEAQESERSRLAQEIHDGPAQVLSNAIFQVEYIERVIDHDDRLARTELRFLRELLRRELGSVRTFISQLRPPVLDELGLDGAVADAVARTTALTGPCDHDRADRSVGPPDGGPADGRPAGRPRSPSECAQARRGVICHRRERHC